MNWPLIIGIGILAVFALFTLVGIDSGGNEVATSDAGALTLMDNADTNYATQKAAFLASREDTLPSSPYSLDKPIPNAGAPSNGTNAVKTLTIGSTPDTTLKFTLGYGAHTSPEITWNATNETLIARIQAALDAMPNIRSGDITVAEGTITAGVGTLTFTFGGYLAALAVGNLTVTKTAGTGSVSMGQTTVAGVTATARLAPKGALLQDTTNAKLYQNTGTAYAPDWASVGDIATADIANSAVTTAKIADVNVTAAKLATDAVETAKIKDLNVTTAKLAAAVVTKAKSATFFSGEVTGTGSAQNVAHGLAAVPAGVLIVPQSHPGTPDTGAFDIAEGSHDATNVVFTGTLNVTFKVLAWA